MKLCGVIAEYNPFHNGHARHLREARQRSGCDGLIVAMDGAFVQRGDVAILDKWTRARMALEHGADLVVELPALFAVRPAEVFGAGGVQLLAALGVQALSFGCEADDLSLLERVADCAEVEPEAVSANIGRKLKEGKSHARARGEALCEWLRLPYEALNRPNLILALAYIRANRALSAPMALHPVLRHGAYHSLALGAEASASAIRAALARGALDEACAAMPLAAARLLREAMARGAYARQEALDNTLLHGLRLASAAELAQLPDVSEGLEMRVKRLCQRVGSRAELLAALKCKRYTHARLNRLCAHALLGLTRERADQASAPTYARLLGFRRDAGALLHHISARAAIPLVTAPVRLRGDACFALEMRATDLQGLCMEEAPARRAARDLTERLVICESQATAH